MAQTGDRPAFLKTGDGMLLTSHEAEYIVENLRAFDIQKVGSADWVDQHEKLEKLNLQAHYNTIANCDEFVMAALISHEKMGLLIHEILIIEIWMENVLPHVFQEVALQASTITISIIIYHEAVIANLLEVILYHQEAYDAIDPDLLLELADYCYRKIVYLNMQAFDDIAFKEKNAKELINMGLEEELKDKIVNIRFGISVCTITILRFLMDYINDLPLCVMARLIDCHDIIMSLIPLVENPPWIRNREKGNIKVIEKYIEGKWLEVSLDDKFKITKIDAQIWLAIYNLIVEPHCRSKCNYDDFHRAQFLKLKRHLNETLIDQLPILKDLKWVLEELSLKLPVNPGYKKQNHLLLEQVPEIRRRMLAQENWKELAQMQLNTIVSCSSSTKLAQHQIEEMLRMFQFGEMMEPSKCANCGARATQRCSRCKFEWYCGKNCQVSRWKSHKNFCDIMRQEENKNPQNKS